MVWQNTIQRVLGLHCTKHAKFWCEHRAQHHTRCEHADEISRIRSPKRIHYKLSLFSWCFVLFFSLPCSLLFALFSLCHRFFFVLFHCKYFSVGFFSAFNSSCSWAHQLFWEKVVWLCSHASLLHILNTNISRELPRIALNTDAHRERERRRETFYF